MFTVSLVHLFIHINIYNLYFATYQISNGGYAGACHGTKAYHQAVVQQNFIALSVIELLVFYLSVYMDGGFEKLNTVLIIRNCWSIRSIHNLSPNCGAQTWSLIQPHTGSFESGRKFQSDTPRLNSENSHQVLRCSWMGYLSLLQIARSECPPLKGPASLHNDIIHKL